MILDEPGDVSFTREPAGNKGGVPQQILPPLYLQTNAAVEPAKIAAANPGLKIRAFKDANSVMTLDANEVAPGGEITGTIAAPANGDTLRLLWIDEAGRVVTAQYFVAANTPPTGSFTFKMPAGTFGREHKIALVSIPPNGGAMKVEASIPVRIVASISWDDYTVFSAGDAARKLFPANSAQIERALSSDENPLIVKTWGAKVDEYDKTRDPKLFQRQPPLFDETAVKTAKAAIEKNIDRRHDGSSLWSLGDAAELSNKSLPFDYDMSPDTLDMFRDWLVNRYGSLNALNAQWKTNFSAWEKVVPPSTDDAKSAMNAIYKNRLSVLKKGDPEKTLKHRGDELAFSISAKELHNPINENLSGWSDFRTFNDFAFGRILREFHTIASAKDSHAQIGFSNAQPPSAWGGWDYENVTRSVDWVEEHNSVVAREIMRGLTTKLHYISASGGQEAASTHRLWDRWLRGDEGCLMPAGDGVPAPLDDIAEMARGVTLLRNGAKLNDDPIAIYYSPRSIYLHWMFDTEVQGSTWLRRDGREDAVHGTMNMQFKSWLLLLEDLGYSPYFIHPEDVVAGGLRYPETKVVILPKVMSLSQNEAAALREFVNAGGCVVADGQCGTFDGMGKRRSPLGVDSKAVGTMDADFGIARKDFQALERGGEFKGDPVASRLTLRGKENKPVGAESPELRVLEPNITAAGGIAHATSVSGSKALFSKAAGKGRYFYLNVCLQDYAQLRADKTAAGFKYNSMTDEAYAAKYGAPTGGEARRLVISDIIDEWVGENPLHVTMGTPATPARGLKRERFDLGRGAAFYALMPLADAGGDETAEIKGAPLDATTPATVGDGKPHCWYDMRSGEYLGSSGMVNVKIEPNRATLLAALPYVVDKLSVKVRRIDQARTFKINADLVLAGTMPGRHVFHFDVLDPAGKVMPFYAANISSETGNCVHQIALGINDAPGTYHVRVRDVLTGKIAEGDLLKEGQDYNGLDFEPKKQ